MFAQDGGEGNDDPYNFDIADRYGGGGSKKGNARKAGGSKLSGGKSHQSRLKKSVLNKTVGSVPSSTPVKAQGSPTLSEVFSAAANDPKTAPLRASAPAATSSALDKAMSFLNKYSTPPTGAASKRTNVATRSSRTANTNADDDEAEMDISLSSEDIGADQTFPRKAQSRLKANRSPDELGLSVGKHQVSRSLTSMRSTRFTTAKELGVSDLDALAGPKASASPVGLQNRHIDTVDAAGSRFETDKDSDSPTGNVRVSGLPLAVNIPGSRDSTAVKDEERGSDGEVASSIESIQSAVVGTLEGIRQEAQAAESGQRKPLGSAFPGLASSREFDDEGSWGSISPTLEREGARLKTTFLRDEAHSSSSTSSDNNREFARTTLGNVVSIEHLATVSGQHVERTVSRGNGENMDYDGTGNHEAGSVGGRVNKVDEMEDDEDDYGDDDFEEVEGNMESEKESPAGHRSAVNLAGVVPQQSASCEADPTAGRSGGGSNVDSNDEAQYQVQRHTPTTSSVPEPPVENSVRGGGECAATRKLRQVWNDLVPPEKSHVPETTDSGTSPPPQPGPGARVSHDDGRGTSPGSNPILPGKVQRDIKHAWGERSASGSRVDGSNSVAPVSAQAGDMNGVARHPPLGAGELEGETPATLGGVSKGGVVIDRSAERHNPGPPPGTDVRMVNRAGTVASVEYAHDPERGVNLRSCGTQAVGSSAAIQVNIAVPGMVGTNSALDAGPRTRALRTPGVGYQRGESYAKWGRFACNLPGGFAGRDYGGAHEAATRSPPSSSRHRPPCSVGGTNKDRIGQTEAARGVGGVDGGNGGLPSGGDSRSKPEGEEVEESTNTDVPTTSHPPPARGAPAYLQMFLKSMAEAQADSCSAWQHVLEDTARKQQLASFPGNDQPRREGGEDLPVGTNEEEVHLDNAARARESQWPEPSGVNVDMFGVMTATQDSFKSQLAIMRENLNKGNLIERLLLCKQLLARMNQIRHRAEVAGQQGYAYNYESLTNTRKVLARLRPTATSQAKALMTVDPCLTVEEAVTLARAGQPDSMPATQVTPSESPGHAAPTEA